MRTAKSIALAAAMFAAAGASAQLVEVIYSNDPSSTKSDVPGIPGLKFDSFDRPQRSPGGNKFIMLARTNSGSTANDALYMLGDSSAGAATVVIREGVTPIDGTRVATNMSDRRAGVIDTGDYAVVIDLDGATTDDRLVLQSTAGVWTFPYREGQSLSLIAPGLLVGSSIGDVNLLTGGVVYARFDSLAGSAVSTNNSALIGNSGDLLVAREGVTVPIDQLGSEAWSSFDVGNFWCDEVGNAIARGTLTGAAATNQVVAVNNQVVLQEGVARFEFFSTPILNIIAVRMEPNANGDWFARGEFSDDTAYIMRNNAFVAWAGPLGNTGVPGVPGETFSNAVWNITNGSTFFMGVANGVGDYVIGGFTSSSNALTNAVWTLNDERVFMRRGVTEVDLNGNGLADDNAFVGITGLTGASLNNITDGGFLTDDGWFYFIGDVVDSGGVVLTEAFMRVRAFEPVTACAACPADYNQDGGVDGADLSAFFTDYEAGELECADTNQDGGIDGGDLSAFFTAYEAGGC